MKTVDIFLFMGQSNMAGRGITSEQWPEKAPKVTEGAGYEYRAVTAPDTLFPIMEPFGVKENREGGIDDGTMKIGSMVSAFVNAYFEETKVPVIAISASKGGSAMEEWKPGSIYLEDALRRYRDCVKYLKENEFEIRHTYVLWCQGETDGDRQTDAGAYLQMFSGMLDVLMKNGIEKLFLVRIGQCNGCDGTDYTSMINLQDKIAGTMEHVIMVSKKFAGMKERGLMKDAYHYFQKAYNEVGTDAGKNAAYYVKQKEKPVL